MPTRLNPTLNLTDEGDWGKFLVFLRNLNPVANKKPDPQTPDFEAALKKLDTLVEKLEGGELTLEQALKHFEEGVITARQCQQALKQAELRVQALLSDSASLSDFPLKD